MILKGKRVQIELTDTITVAPLDNREADEPGFMIRLQEILKDSPGKKNIEKFIRRIKS